MKAIPIASMIAIFLFVSLPANTCASSIRCGVRLITVGDFKARVLAECGEPDHIEVWEEERIYGFRHHPGYYGIFDRYEHGNPGYENGTPYRIKKLVVIEEWTYNHGPGRFMDHLRLENGVVRRIVSGDYGY